VSLAHAPVDVRPSTLLLAIGTIERLHQIASSEGQRDAQSSARYGAEDGR